MNDNSDAQSSSVEAVMGFDVQLKAAWDAAWYAATGEDMDNIEDNQVSEYVRDRSWLAWRRRLAGAPHEEQ